MGHGDTNTWVVSGRARLLEGESRVVATTLPTRNRISRTVADLRAPRVCPDVCRSRWPEAPSGKLGTVLLDRIPISGISAMMRATVRSATPLMERKAWLSWLHSGSAWMSAAMRCSRSRIWRRDQRQQIVERSLDDGLEDEPLLVQLRSADLGELTQTRDQGAQMLLGARRHTQRLRLLDLGIPGDHAGVDGIGLFQPPHALGELAYGTRVEDGHRQSLFRELREGLLLVAAGGFHGDELDLMGMAEGGQFCDSFGVVGERSLARRLARCALPEKRKKYPLHK